MKIQAIQSALGKARAAATLENAEFGSVWRNQGTPVPVKMADGSPVTEANVTDFIRERTRLYRDTWVIPRIEEALALIAASVPHPYIRAPQGLGRCQVCEKGSEHSLHRGF